MISSEIISQLKQALENFKKDHKKNVIEIEGSYVDNNYLNILPHPYQTNDIKKTIDHFKENFLPSDIIMKIYNSTSFSGRQLYVPPKPPKKIVEIVFNYKTLVN